MDEADRADAERERSLAESLRMARGDIPPGQPGECDMCGEFSPRLVRGACARCRDLHKLP